MLQSTICVFISQQKNYNLCLNNGLKPVRLFITGISTAALRIFQLITSKPLQSRLQNAKHSILCSLPSLEMQTTAKTVAKDTVAGHNPILYCSNSILSISAVYEKFGCSVSNPLNLQMHLFITYVTSLLCFQRFSIRPPGSL